MRYFITGANGQLGYDIVRQLNKKGNEVYATDYDTVDITSRADVLNVICECNPDVIINCAAWTAVDQAEDDRDIAFDVNVTGVKNLVEAATLTNAKLIHISTEYVFDGEGTREYEADEPTQPVNYYGETKRLGEEEVQKYDKSFIVRISWAFGKNGSNFIKTMLKLAETRDELNVVNDQIGSPTYTKDLAILLEDMSFSDKYGIYHATNEGTCSWAELAQFAFDVSGINVKVNKVTSSEFPTKAKRPKNSRMSKRTLDENGFERLPHWKDAVERYIFELEKVGEII